MRHHVHRLLLKFLGYKLVKVIHHETGDDTFVTEAFYARRPGYPEKRVIVAAWLSEEEMR